jgi:hypothetical protein
MTAVVRRRTMLPVIGMMQHVIGVMLPGVGLMHGNNASYCRVSNPLRLEWCLCHPSDPMWWHQLCGCRSPPAGPKFGGRWRHTRPEGAAQVLSNDFAWLSCSSLMSSTTTMCQYPQSWPPPPIVNGSPMYPPIWLTLTTRVREMNYELMMWTM